MSACPFDLSNPELYQQGHPREAYAWMRQQAPVCWQENAGESEGFWAVSRQKDLDFVSKNPQLFSSEARSCMPGEPDEERLVFLRMQLINMDPPRHLKYRRLIRNAFTPKVVDSYRARFEEVASDILDRAMVSGRCDFVTAIASELPLIAICELMGVPLERRQRLFELTNIMIGMDDPELQTSEEDGVSAMIEMFMLAQEIAAAHRANPGDSIVNVLLNGTVEDEPLSDDEFSNFFLLLIVAGNETTRTVTTHGMRLLIAHQQYDLLQSRPDLLEGAIEEFLRYNPAVITFKRTAMDDVEVGGQLIRKGERVQLYYGSASADESVFSDGDTFDITRSQREDVKNNHRAFGVGEHFCIGSHLARLELEVIFREILARIYRPRFDGEIRWMRSNFINAIKAMPIAFDVE
ncbi:cytochrome P450 [Parahaliea aestuarii]|uniref:Cytochrome P450 n=1 Tax=Parahaliea aestuarii TaxID=1852021 RepID=A0A5C8ZSX8_9GAMM|nr:cytochrome P450 [Parahaliea aestuarii]TXS91618.1 cytochrome P450 [Parahaliea aestuarii]